MIKKYSLSLPDEYQEVDYIVNSGTQSIDTGWIRDFSKDIEIEATVKPLISNSRYCIISDYSVDPFSLSLELTANGEVRAYINSHTNNNIVSSNQITAGQFNTIIYKFIASELKGSIELSGVVTSKISTTDVKDQKAQNSAMIFVDRAERYQTFSNPLQIKKISIKENDEIVHTFIPCYRKIDNAAGMYDIINNSFRTNQGSGTFSIGENVPLWQEIGYKKYINGQWTEQIPKKYENGEWQ